MRPVPTHLRPILVTLKSVRFPAGQSGVRGHLKCRCGSENFIVSYAADPIEERGEHFLRTTEHEGRYFFIVKAECSQCAKVHVLLDSHSHGWEGLLCSSQEDRDALPPPFSLWDCPKCGNNSHAVTIEVGGDDRSEALLNGEGELDDTNWFDAFGSMNIEVKCSGECPPITMAECETQ